MVMKQRGKQDSGTTFDVADGVSAARAYIRGHFMRQEGQGYDINVMRVMNAAIGLAEDEISGQTFDSRNEARNAVLSAAQDILWAGNANRILDAIPTSRIAEEAIGTFPNLNTIRQARDSIDQIVGALGLDTNTQSRRPVRRSVPRRRT